ncbi:N-fatty-acyl-amino acid synthase/hydrolase PM20D1 [Dirofilaria immitis]
MVVTESNSLFIFSMLLWLFQDYIGCFTERSAVTAAIAAAIAAATAVMAAVVTAAIAAAVAAAAAAAAAAAIHLEFLQWVDG